MDKRKKRERSVNFTPDEANRLLVVVRPNIKALENKKSDSVSRNEKDTAWKAIEERFNSYNASETGVYRSAKTLKLKYEGMKKDVRKKLSVNGAAKLTPTEQKVVELMLLPSEGAENLCDLDPLEIDASEGSSSTFIEADVQVKSEDSDEYTEQFSPQMTPLHKHVPNHTQESERAVIRHSISDPNNIIVEINKEPPSKKLCSAKCEDVSSTSKKEDQEHDATEGQKIHCNKIRNNLDIKNKEKQAVNERICPFISIESDESQALAKQSKTTESPQKNTGTHNESLINSEKTPTKENRYSCDECDKKFYYKYRLIKHQMSHAGIKPYACDICDSKFAENGALKRHKNIHTGLTPYTCEVCDKRFVNKANLNQHVKVHSEIRPYACDKCDRKYTNKAFLTRHMKTHTAFKPHACDICQKRFLFSYAKNRHVMKIHSGIPDTALQQYICDLCNKVFNHKSSLTFHLQRHTGLKPFTCNYCNKSFPCIGSLNIHSIIHTEKQYACDKCSKKFSRKQNLITHLRQYHQFLKPFVCDVCNRRFAEKGSLAKHVVMHTGVRAFTCEICKQSFLYKSNLNIHLRLHSGERPFACNVCDKRFVSSSRLAQHSQTHTETFVCDICNKTISTKNNLIAHKKIHTDERPHACNECGKAFRRKYHLKSHLESHSGIKPFACDKCEKTFSRKEHFTAHMRTHTGEKPYACDICGKNFGRKDHLDSHLEKMHKGSERPLYEDSKVKDELITPDDPDEKVNFNRATGQTQLRKNNKKQNKLQPLYEDVEIKKEIIIEVPAITDQPSDEHHVVVKVEMKQEDIQEEDYKL